MDAKLQERFFADFPSLFRDRDQSSLARGIECGNGWYALIRQLSEAIETAAKEAGIPMHSTAWTRCRQVKEKMGELRFVVFAVPGHESTSERIALLCQAASEASMHVCEQCGLAGKLVDGMSLCATCFPSGGEGCV